MMGIMTGIAWTDRTWNPHQGCHKKSPGCKHCYMFRDKKRYGQDANTVVRSSPHTFNQPISKKWATPARVFVCSWSDFFIEEADAWRAEEWAIIRSASHLTFQICTKRPERIADHLPPDWGSGWPHVWIGVTAEDQERANERLPILLDTPAAVRFVSVEPMLGPVDLVEPIRLQMRRWPRFVDQVIIGAESGQPRRLLDLEHARALAHQVHACGAAVFLKQIHVGSRLVTDPSDPDWPSWGKREFPRPR